MPDSVVSIDSPSSSEYSYDPEEDARAQEEWEESVQEIQRLFSAILLPYLGKYFGRSFSYWAFSRYLRLGFGKSFFMAGM